MSHPNTFLASTFSAYWHPKDQVLALLSTTIWWCLSIRAVHCTIFVLSTTEKEQTQQPAHSLQALHAHWRAAKVSCSLKDFSADSYRPLRVPWSLSLLTSRPGSPSLPCQRTTGTALASLRPGHCCPCLIFPRTDNLAAKFCLTKILFEGRFQKQAKNTGKT